MDITRICDGCRRDIGISEEILCNECVNRMHIYIKELERERDKLKEKCNEQRTV